MKKPRYIRKEKGQLELNTIVILVIALLVVAAVMMGTGGVVDFFKKVFGIMEAKHDNADICENYREISGEQDMLDLIYYTKQGYCGGDRKDDVFKFTITSPGITFDTSAITNYDCKDGTGAPTSYFCGKNYYPLINYPEVPADTLTDANCGPPYGYLQFGDIEMYESNDCEHRGEWTWPFSGEADHQACDAGDSDLVIIGPEALGIKMTPCEIGVMTGCEYWCYNGEFGWAAHSLNQFTLRPAPPTGEVDSAHRFDSWAIRRAGENVVICLIAEPV